MDALIKYDPDQPREPKGSPDGGRWSGNFNAWFAGSKIVDDKGEPIRLYHGTTKSFDQFDPTAKGVEHGWYGDGIYFTASDELGSEYARYGQNDKDFPSGANVMPVYLAIKNPYVWPQERPAALDRAQSAAVRKELQAAGYDGVIAPNYYDESKAAKMWEVVAFHPEQIKSAIGNRGTFDPKSKNITKADNEFYYDRRVGKTYRRLSTGFDWQKDSKQVDRYAAAVYDWLQATKHNLVKLIVGREALTKYNEWHDPENGQFTFGPEGAIGSLENHPLRQLTNKADKELTGDAARAVTEFIGHEPGKIDGDVGEHNAFGIMVQDRLERIVRDPSSPAYKELEEKFAPVKEALRREAGDNVVLYRYQSDVAAETSKWGKSPPPERAVLSWTSDPKFTDSYAGVRPVPALIPESVISRMEREYRDKGSTWVTHDTELRREKDSPYPNIYTRGQHITDTDSVRDFVADINADRREGTARNEVRRSKIIAARVPIDDIVWISDRAGQSEFIVLNTPGAARRIDNRGNKLIKYDPDQPRDPAGSSTGGQWTSGFQPLDFTREDVLADSSFVYHATSLERLYDIADEGLLNVHNPDDFTDQSEWPDGGQEKRAYFAKSPAVARSFTPEGTPVLLRTSRSDLIKPERGTGDFYTTKPVETSRLEYLSTNGWEPVKSSLIKAGPTTEDLAEWARIAEELSRALTMGDVQLLVQEAQAIGGYVAQQTSRQVLARFGMADTSELFNTIDPDMIAFARERAAEMVGMRWEDDELRPSRNARKRIDTSTRDMVRRLIATYLAAGRTLEDIVKELEGMGDPAYPFSKQRAFVIASTEIANAASHGELATAKRMRDEEGLIVTKSWAVADTPCPICDANHAQGEIDLDEPFQSGDMAPTAHPNAVFEGHSYISYGSTVQALRSRYDGPAISVEASFLDDPVKIASRYFSDLSDSFKGDVFSKHLEGFFQNLFGDHNLIVYKLAIGPNHPMLTDRGFIPARLLKKGDKLLYDLRLAGLSVTTNDKQIPLVENAFETLGASGRIVAAGAAATNFHGDEAFIYGEVDAVLPNLDLLPKLDSSFLQKLCKCRLTGAYTSPDHLASCGACQETFRAVFGAASGRVGGFGEFLSLFGGFGGPIVSESLDGFDASLLPLFGGEGGPFCFTTLTVGQTQKTSFHGWAFDASTTQSIYNIGGVVVKNCRCALLTHAGFPGEQTLRLVDSMVDFHRAVLGDDLFGELIKYDPDQPRAPEG